MATSKIIKDFTSSNISIEIALKKLIVLLSYLNNENLTNWAKNELNGYNESDDVPSYRKVKGVIFADFMTGDPISGGLRFSNYPLKPVNLDNEYKDKLICCKIRQSVSSLETLVNSKTITFNPIIPDMLQYIPKICNIDATVLAARVEFDYTVTKDILSKIDTKILDILLILDKQFGNLDDLDIDMSNVSEDEIKTLSQKIEIIVFDNHIEIGNNNKFKNSNVITNK